MQQTPHPKHFFPPHTPGVDLEDVVAGRVVGVWKLDLPVDPAWPEQRGIEDIDSVRGHQHLQ